MAEGAALRKRRVRVFGVFFTFMLVFTLLSSSFYWSDFAVTPGVSVSYVSYDSSDGVVISGALFRPVTQEGPLPGVVVVHGITAYKEGMNRISVELARHGFIVLAIDLRDHGMSTGQCTFGLPSAEPQDVLRGLEYIRTVPGVDPSTVALVGHSFGGMVSLTAASLPQVQVNATVVWAAPINLTALDRDNHATVAYVVDKRVLPPDLETPEQLRIRSPITYISDLRPNSTLFLHSADDTLIPINQSYEAANATRAEGQRMEVVQGNGHAMNTAEVIDKTIAFIEQRTKGKVSEPFEPAFLSFQRDAAALTLFITLLNIPLAWLSWEYFCTRNPSAGRHYNYPADRRRSRGWTFGLTDVVIFGGLVSGLAFLSGMGVVPLAFQGILPAPALFQSLAVLGLALCATAYVFGRVERRTRGRDDKRSEEGENMRRSVATALPVLAMIPLSAGLEYVLFLGADVPHSLNFLLVMGVLFLFTLGFEAVLRLRIQRKLRDFVGSYFGRTGLANATGHIIVGTLLYFAMIFWVLLWLFQGFVSLPGDAVAFAIAFGAVTSTLYYCTKSILPGAIVSAAYITWVLNAAFHF